MKYYIEYPILVICNQRCPYCFNKERFEKGDIQRNTFTLEEWCAFRDKHLYNAEELRVHLHGGEPFYGENRKLLREFLEGTNQETLDLLSNGISPIADYTDTLKGYEHRIAEIGFTFHRSVMGDNPELVERYKDNVNYVRSMGIPVYVKELLRHEDNKAIRENKRFWEEQGVPFKIQDLRDPCRVNYTDEDYALLSLEYLHPIGSCYCKVGYKTLLILNAPYRPWGESGNILACWHSSRIVGDIKKNVYLRDYEVVRTLSGYEVATQPEEGLDMLFDKTAFLKHTIDSLEGKPNSVSKAIVDFVHSDIYESYLTYIIEMDHKDRWTPNLNMVDMEITTNCTLKCYNCDRFCRQAPSNEMMTIEQIQKFIDQSIALNKQWTKIVLTGGEPTTHPDIMTIASMLVAYKVQHLPTVTLMINTNGYTQETKDILAAFPPEIGINNSQKINDVNLFSPVNFASIDIASYAQADYTKACAITELCGLGVSRYGFYPCGVAASIDRIMGYDMGIKSLEDVSMEAVKVQLTKTCRLCGKFRDMYIDCLGYDPVWITYELMSETWKQAFRQYASNPPVLSTY